MKATKAEAGAIGAARRWGPRRIVRIDSLDPAVATAVRALIEANAAAKAARAAPDTGQAA